MKFCVCAVRPYLSEECDRIKNERIREQYGVADLKTIHVPSKGWKRTEDSFRSWPPGFPSSTISRGLEGVDAKTYRRWSIYEVPKGIPTIHGGPSTLKWQNRKIKKKLKFLFIPFKTDRIGCSVGRHPIPSQILGILRNNTARSC